MKENAIKWKVSNTVNMTENTELLLNKRDLPIDIELYNGKIVTNVIRDVKKNNKLVSKLVDNNYRRLLKKRSDGTVREEKEEMLRMLEQNQNTSVFNMNGLTTNKRFFRIENELELVNSNAQQKLYTEINDFINRRVVFQKNESKFDGDLILTSKKSAAKKSIKVGKTRKIKVTKEERPVTSVDLRESLATEFSKTLKRVTTVAFEQIFKYKNKLGKRYDEKKPVKKQVKLTENTIYKDKNKNKPYKHYATGTLKIAIMEHETKKQCEFDYNSVEIGKEKERRLDLRVISARYPRDKMVDVIFNIEQFDRVKKKLK